MLITSAMLAFANPVAVMGQLSEPDFEELGIYLRVEGIGGFDINCLLRLDDNHLFIPVTDLFTLLRINQETSAEYDSVRGFFIDEQKRYIIDYKNLIIRYGNSQTVLNPREIIRTESGLYLFSGIFGRVFGLYCNFNFRALSVELKTDLELPAIRELRLNQMRKNIEALRGEIVADTILNRQYHLFRHGMVDWSVNSSQTSGSKPDNRIALSSGIELFGGETNLDLNYSTREGFDTRNQQYLWRWANNDIALVKQVRAGRIPTNAIATINHPVNGISVTNSPTTYRRSFGLYTVTDYTEPGWSVELYINNVLVNYTVADATGFYKFDIPLVYGTSDVTFKYYGPYGEQRTRTETLNIPFNFLPKGEVEYTMNGGLVQDSSGSVFSHGEVKYGINRYVTVGSGIEYLSSVRTGTTIPFLNASITPHANIMIAGSYNHDVVSRGKVSYRNRSHVLFEVDYARYQQGQKAINYNYLEERRISLSYPVKYEKAGGYTRFAYRQNVYKELSFNTAELMISAYVGPFNANLTTMANWISGSNPVAGCYLGAGFKVKQGLTVRSLTQFDFSGNGILSQKLEMEAKISRSGFVMLTWDNYFQTSQSSLEVAFRYDLPFAQTNTSVRYGNQRFSANQGARGSLAFGSGNGYVHTDNRSASGRCGVSIIPFLDINHNGEKEPGEDEVFGLDVRINGGRILARMKDSIIRVVDLEPHTSYLIELDNSGFDNISWQLKTKAMKIYVDPNQFKTIRIPVYPMGEVSGTVYLQKKNHLKGIGRILLNIYDHEDRLIHRLMTEQDGYYTFLGLSPGKYKASLDSRQLEKTSMKIKSGAAQYFEIKVDRDGDIVDGIDFIISSSKDEKVEIPDTIRVTGEDKQGSIMPQRDTTNTREITELKKPVPSEKPDHISIPEIFPAISDSIIAQTDTLSRFEFSTETGIYYIQFGAFKIRENADKFIRSLEQVETCPYGVVYEYRFYNVRSGYFITKQEARLCLNKLTSKGYKCFIGKTK